MKALSAGLALAALLALVGCGENESTRDDLPPAQPRFVTRSADSTYPQRGIRAEPVTSPLQHWVHLEWEAGDPADEIAGYRVYRAAESQPLRRYVVRDLRLEIDVPRGQATYEWIDKGDSTGFGTGNMLDPDPETGESRGYFWYLRAYDDRNNVSDFSVPVYYRLISNPFAVTVGRLDADEYVLGWQYQPSSETDRPSYYAIRVYEPGSTADVVLFRIERRYGSSEAVTLDFSAPARPMTPGQSYVCQLNAICDRRNADHADTVAGAAVATTFTYTN